MSQHLINDFIHRTYLFKPFYNNKLTTQKLVKYQKSNDHNHNSPEDIEESLYKSKSTFLVKNHKPQEDKTQKQTNNESKIKHVDITI